MHHGASRKPPTGCSAVMQSFQQDVFHSTHNAISSKDIVHTHVEQCREQPAAGCVLSSVKDS
jgi:hypothetical protein